jgi:hypothetical protein
MSDTPIRFNRRLTLGMSRALQRVGSMPLLGGDAKVLATCEAPTQCQSVGETQAVDA